MYLKIVMTLLVLVLAVIAVELSRYRTTAPAGVDTVDAANAIFDLQIDELDARESTVEQALDILRHKAGVPIIVNWDELRLQGVDRKQRVDIVFHKVPLGGALQAVVGPDYAIQYNYDARQRCITLGPRAVSKLGEFLVVTYDVRDLLDDKFWGEAAVKEASPQDRRETLLSLVTEVLGRGDFPDSVGGTIPSVNIFSGRLVVVQTVWKQRQVRRLLWSLRKEVQ